jgi:anti-sigma B factor antagonist
MALTIDREDGDRIRLTVRGEVDLYTSPELRKAIMKAVPAAQGGVEVELSAVDYMDSSGVATLVEGFKTARESAKAFILMNPSKSVMRVLELARLDAVFEINRAP